MAKIFLALHVLVAVIAVGPVTVAASMFPGAVRRGRGPSEVRLLYRVCRVYAVVGVLVPFFGFATAGSMGVMGDTWVIVSIALTAVAAAVLVLLVLPRQKALAGGGTDDRRSRAARLAMYTGAFNLLWVTVTVLMIIRPGSTTGA